MSAHRRAQAGLRAPSTLVREKRFRPWTLPRRVAFWLAAVIAFLVFAANSSASVLYRVYQAQFRFSATTLTALFTLYILVLLVTLLLFGSLSDYVGRRRVMAAGLAADAVGCVVFLIAHQMAHELDGQDGGRLSQPWVVFAAAGFDARCQLPFPGRPAERSALEASDFLAGGDIQHRNLIVGQAARPDGQ